MSNIYNGKLIQYFCAYNYLNIDDFKRTFSLLYLLFMFRYFFIVLQIKGTIML